MGVVLQGMAIHFCTSYKVWQYTFEHVTRYDNTFVGSELWHSVCVFILAR